MQAQLCHRRGYRAADGKNEKGFRWKAKRDPRQYSTSKARGAGVSKWRFSVSLVPISVIEYGLVLASSHAGATNTHHERWREPEEWNQIAEAKGGVEENRKIIKRDKEYKILKDSGVASRFSSSRISQGGYHKAKGLLQEACFNYIVIEFWQKGGHQRKEISKWCRTRTEVENEHSDILHKIEIRQQEIRNRLQVWHGAG